MPWKAERRSRRVKRSLRRSSLVRTGVGRPSGWAHFIQSSFRVSCMINSIGVGNDWLPHLGMICVASGLGASVSS